MKQRGRIYLVARSETSVGPTYQACEVCTRPTRLVGIESGAHTNQAELCTYECSNCGHAQTMLRDRSSLAQ